MEADEFQKYVDKAWELLNSTSQGKHIINNAAGNTFHVTKENIILLDKPGISGRCFREIDKTGTPHDKLFLNHKNSFSRDPLLPLESEDDRVKGLAAILSHELTHAKQYNLCPEITPVDDLRPQIEMEKTPSVATLLAENSAEAILEADCRTASLMIMRLSNPSPHLQQYHSNTEQHKAYMNPEDFKRLSLLSSHTLNQSQALQQRLARDSFKAILENSRKTYPPFMARKASYLGYDGENLLKSGKLNLDYNSSACLQAIKAAYSPEVYGNTSLFLETIPGLSPENKKQLQTELTASAPNVEKLRGLSSPSTNTPPVTKTVLHKTLLQKQIENKTNH